MGLLPASLPRSRNDGKKGASPPVGDLGGYYFGKLNFFYTFVLFLLVGCDVELSHANLQAAQTIQRVKLSSLNKLIILAKYYSLSEQG
jgi:hypothetical protein